MCGRYLLTSDEKKLTRQFAAKVTARLIDRYNIAPSQPVPVVRACQHHHANRKIDLLRWGLIPHWVNDPAIGSRMINARSETVSQKPAYRAALRYRRCLLPADGFYEWKAAGKARKQPYLIRMADEQTFALAGLWEHWQDQSGNEIESCTIITTEPNEMMARIHNRMPAIIDPDEYEQWLNTDVQDVDAVTPLLKPYPAELMMCTPVGTYVNNPKNNDPRCIELSTG